MFVGVKSLIVDELLLEDEELELLDEELEEDELELLEDELDEDELELTEDVLAGAELELFPPRDRSPQETNERQTMKAKPDKKTDKTRYFFMTTLLFILNIL
jgi:hypothetical protein